MRASALHIKNIILYSDLTECFRDVLILELITLSCTTHLRKNKFLLDENAYSRLLNIFSSISDAESIPTNNFQKSAWTSKWGEVKDLIGVLRRGRRFKNKSTDFDSYNLRTLSGMPMGARGYPGTQIWHIWDFMINLKRLIWFFEEKNSFLYDFAEIAKLATLI